MVLSIGICQAVTHVHGMSGDSAYPASPPQPGPPCAQAVERAITALRAGRRLSAGQWAALCPADGPGHPVPEAARAGIDPALVAWAALPSSAPPRVKTRLRPFVEALEAGGAPPLKKQVESLNAAGGHPVPPGADWRRVLGPLLVTSATPLGARASAQIRGIERALRADAEIDAGAGASVLCATCDLAVKQGHPGAARVFAAGTICMLRDEMSRKPRSREPLRAHDAR